MAQTGYTPIQLYYSTTASAIPLAANLAAGELAINTLDEKLYFKNSSGTVKLLASSAASTGTVSTVSVVSANGLAGTVANATTTPAITLSTTVTGVLKGNGTAISAAVSGTDYAPATSGTSILYGNGSGGFSNVTIGSGISFAGGTISATGTGGTVTSVALSGGTTGLTVSGSPITTSGTITLAGTLAVANGGTGQTSYTNGQLLIGNTTGNTLTKATLTAGAGISITNGAGSITIAATGLATGTTATAPITLTVASAQLQYLTSTVFGAAINLPSATTLSKGPSVFSLYNAGNYLMSIYNNSGTLLGFINPGTQVNCGLADNSTAAGTWSLDGAVYIGVDAQASIPFNQTASSPNINYVAISSTSHLITMGTSGGLAAVVYDDTTNSFGSVAVVHTINAPASIGLYAVDSSNVLVVYGTSTTGYAQILGISGTTITVNSASTITSSGTWATGALLIQKLTNGVYVFAACASAPQVFALTVSGTSVTWGSSQPTPGANTSVKPPIFNMGNNKIVVGSMDAATIGIQFDAYSVSSSGVFTTLATTGTLATASQSNFNARFLTSDTIGYFFVSGTLQAGLVKFNGTSFTGNTTVSTSNVASPTAVALLVTNSKFLVVASSATELAVSVVYDNGSTVPVASSEYRTNVAVTLGLLGITSDAIYFAKIGTSVTNIQFCKATITGNDPVVKVFSGNRSPAAQNLSTSLNLYVWDTTVNGMPIQSYQYQNSYLYGNSGAYSFSTNLASSFKGLLIKNDNATVVDLPLEVFSSPNTVQTVAVRQSQSAMWAFATDTQTTTTTYNPYLYQFILQRIKVV